MHERFFTRKLDTLSLRSHFLDDGKTARRFLRFTFGFGRENDAILSLAFLVVSKKQTGPEWNCVLPYPILLTCLGPVGRAIGVAAFFELVTAELACRRSDFLVFCG